MPEALRIARRELEQIAGLRVSGETLSDASGSKWAIPVEVSLDRDATFGFPAESRWYLVTSSDYPWGEIEIYPATDGGIIETYPHQDHNGAGDGKFPWRDGDVCVKAPSFVLGRAGGDPDPKGEPSRLVWYAARLRSWVENAAAGTLSRTGDPFELPQFRTSGGTIAFSEDETTYSSWALVSDQCGVAELTAIKEPFPCVVRRFLSLTQRELVAPAWGKYIATKGVSRMAAWIRLPAIPVLGPYGAPMTWGDLRGAASSAGINLDDLLRKALRAVRGKKAAVLLIGFPIPSVVGGSNTRLHWQPALVGGLATDSVPGFRSSETSSWKHDLQIVLADGRKVAWLSAGNWAADQLATRGQLSARLRCRKVLLVGAGALGSAVAELLVRGGVFDVSVVDGDIFEAGNLARHTLSIDEVDEPKASALASRLNRISPHAKVTALPGTLQTLNSAALSADLGLVVDCSGEDEVLHLLSVRELEAPAVFASVSLGRGAIRAYLFTSTGRRFPASDYWSALAPHLRQDEVEFPDANLPWQGIGCWHPVFPARTDHVWATACHAVDTLDRWCEGSHEGSELKVIHLSGDAQDATVGANHDRSH